jgi:hypothetical protein
MNKNDNIDYIREKHIKKGLMDIGYHYFVDSKGDVFPGRKVGLIGAHCNMQNVSSIGVCLSGKHKFSKNQLDKTVILLISLMDNYKIKKESIFTHKYFEEQSFCPDFDIDIILKKIK